MKKKLNKIYVHKGITVLLILILIIKFIYLFKLKPSYNLNSDDVSYLLSGTTFLETGKITMHGTLSAQIMPGMTFVIAFLALIFGKGVLLIITIKILWIIMGTIVVIYFYKTILLLINSKKIAVLCSSFFLALDYAWMDNLILTETPFLLFTIIMFYFSIKFSITKKQKDYFLIIVFYILSLMFRTSIGLYPIFLLLYLLIKGHNIKILFKNAIISGLILLLVLTPWTIRNYIHFNKFIPLTYGIGNPLLLGTYQGMGFPDDKDVDYELAYNKLPKDIKNNLTLTENDEKFYLKKYSQLELDKEKSKLRMKIWWEKDPKSMLISYFYYKPKTMIHSTFYWTEQFAYDNQIIEIIRRVELVLFIMAIILILYKKLYLKEFIFIIFVYFYQIALYSYTFAFGRYAQTLYFYKYIIIALGIKILFDIYKSNKICELII